MRLSELVELGLYRLAAKQISRLGAPRDDSDRRDRERALRLLVVHGQARLLDRALRVWRPSARPASDTLLHTAARRGCVACCEVLASRHGVQMTADADGRLPLHVAALEGHVGVVCLFCSAYPAACRYVRDR